MTSDQKKRDFSSVMDKLRADYISKLSAKADQLAEALGGVRANEDGASARVAEQVHRLAGTAGSFGIHDVSALANSFDVRFYNGESPGDLAEELGALVQLLRDRSQQPAG